MDGIYVMPVLPWMILFLRTFFEVVLMQELQSISIMLYVLICKHSRSIILQISDLVLVNVYLPYVHENINIWIVCSDISISEIEIRN